MRASDIMTPRTSMSDIDMVVQAARDLKSATATFDPAKGRASIRFNLDGQDGWMMVQARPKGMKSAQEVMHSRIRACATSQSRGRSPVSLEAAITVLKRGPLGPNAIRMLVGHPDMEIIALKWDTIVFGLGSSQVRESQEMNVGRKQPEENIVAIEVRQSPHTPYKFYSAYEVYADGTCFDSNIPGIQTGNKGFAKVRRFYPEPMPIKFV